MKSALSLVCTCLGLFLVEASAQKVALKSHVIPVGDAGVGLVVKLPPIFTMNPTPGGFPSFGRRDLGGGRPDIWAHVWVDSNRMVNSGLVEAGTSVKRDTVTMLSKPVEWLKWEGKESILTFFSREAYLEGLPALVHDEFKAKRLEGVVVTISIGGADEALVNRMQKCFVNAELRESTLPPADAKPPARFVEAHYGLPSPRFAGESYEFHAGRFTCHHFSDVGSRPAEGGSYKLAGSRVTLLFDTPKPGPFVFYYRELDGVRMLLSPLSLQTFEAKRRLSSRFYFSIPGADRNDRDSWQKALKEHPTFEKRLEERERE
jgi:hypothetical protein